MRTFDQNDAFDQEERGGAHLSQRHVSSNVLGWRNGTGWDGMGEGIERDLHRKEKSFFYGGVGCGVGFGVRPCS